MRKTRFSATMMWVSLIWLTVETYLGRLIALKTRRMLMTILAMLNRV